MADRVSPLSVTIISGFFGADKSSLIDDLLQSSEGRRTAASRCESQEDVVETVKLAAELDIDQLLLECGGAADPMEVAAQFIDTGPAGAELARLARIDSMLTVVDTADILNRFCSWTTLAEEGFGEAHAGSRLVVDVVTEQLEFANVVILNKTDCVSDLVVQNVETLVRALNRGARVMRRQAGAFAPKQLPTGPAFDFERTRSMAGWVQAFNAVGTEDVRIVERVSSFLYSARPPFHPQRFMQFVQAEWPGVVRSRGHFWLASRMDWMGELIQAGGARRYRAAGVWRATMLAGNTVDAHEVERMLGRQWDPRFGDRRQEIAFAGIDMDEALLRARLDECLLTDAEVRRGPEIWQGYADPFPSWDGPRTRPTDRSLN